VLLVAAIGCSGKQSESKKQHIMQKYGQFFSSIILLVYGYHDTTFCCYLGKTQYASCKLGRV